jgi:nucleoside-diphosphate-sugar epimerase
MSDLKTAIPKGSWVLVTGATGFVASHTIKLFLERGFKVRGTVRDVKGAAWLTQDVFKSFADHGDFELVHVPDLGAKHAFDDAIKGVSAIAHVASILSFDSDPHKVITPVVDCINSILETALNESSVKSIVYTSSIAAAVDLTPGVTAHAGPDAWNEKAVKLAWAPPPNTPNHWHWVYQASKVEAEKAVWAFVEKNKPRFAVNVVSPATILGGCLTKKHVVTPYPWIKNLWDGNEEIGALFKASKSTYPDKY